MERGYVKVYRKIIDSQVFKNPNLLKVWLWCLLRADHKGNWVPVRTGKGASEVWVGPGQFIFGRESASKQLGMKPSSVRNRMKKLENLKNLTAQADRQYSIITICNWELFQSNEKPGRTAQKDSQRTAKGQPKDTDKHNKHSKKTTFGPSSTEFGLADFLFQEIKKRSENFKKPNLKSWAGHVDRMIRLDKRDPGEIESVIRWAQGDDFWRNNVLSTAKLRDKYDQLAMKMAETGGKANSPHPPQRRKLT